MGYTTVPYVIAYAGEEVTDRLTFEPHRGSDGGMRLAYDPPKPGDRIAGILRARVHDMHTKPDRRGPERMRKLNTRRQWRCMDRLLCQVCSRPATDPATRLTWWILVPAVLDSEWRTNAPPTCRGCIEVALRECPMLQDNASVCTVSETEAAGVLADMYVPGAGGPELSVHNVFVAWDAFAYHPRALATSQVVQLHGVRIEETP